MKMKGIKYSKYELSLIKQHNEMLEKRKQKLEPSIVKEKPLTGKQRKEKFFNETIHEISKYIDYKILTHFIKFNVNNQDYDYYPKAEKLLKVPKDGRFQKELWQKMTPDNLIEKIKTNKL